MAATVDIMRVGCVDGITTTAVMKRSWTHTWESSVLRNRCAFGVTFCATALRLGQAIAVGDGVCNHQGQEGRGDVVTRGFSKPHGRHHRHNCQDAVGHTERDRRVPFHVVFLLVTFVPSRNPGIPAV